MNFLIASDKKILDKGRVLVNNIFATQKNIDSIFYMTDKVTKKEFDDIFTDDRVKQVIIDNIDMPESPMRRLSRVTNARLIAADLLPVNKVLYLDIDILLREDVTDVKFKNKPIMAVHDNGWKTLYNWEHFLPFGWIAKPFKKWRGYNGYNYINGGVIWFNLEMLRGLDLMKELVEFMKKYKNPKFMDQDFINYRFRDEITLLPLEYNTTAYEFNNWKEGRKYNDGRKIPKIVHFTGKKKPWNYKPKFAEEWKQHDKK